MKKIEAQTLEEALIIATKELGCSVVDLEYTIIQNHSKGFLGIGKKPAIICAQSKIKLKSADNHTHNSMATESRMALRESDWDSYEESNDHRSKHKSTPTKWDLQKVSKQVQMELEELFGFLPYRLNEILVQPYDENTLFIKIDGEDSALLIGKEGYRYKAISYLIFNWVNHVYGLMVRLEIAEFLHNQEEMIANYLVSTIESVRATGRAQTKPLDGVLAHIALKQLREKFPDKYVSFRLNSDGERYIVINDFYRC